MKPILKKADEMEMAINLKAARCAYAFLETAIMVYCIIEFVTTGAFSNILFLFGCLGSVIFWGVKLVETQRLSQPEEPDEE